MILQPLRLHSMGPGYERLNILFHHDLNTQDSKTRKARQQVRSNTQPRRRILTAPTLQRSLAACLKLLINLPCLLDFLRGLLEGAGNSLVGGSGVLVFLMRLTISSSSPCVHAVNGSWYALRRAMVNSCRSSRGPCTTVGDGQNDEAPGWGRTEPSESESGVEEGVITGPRWVFAAMGAGTLGGGSRSTRASGRRSWSVPGPGTSRRTSRGGDSSGMYQVEDVSKGRVLVRGGVRDRSDAMRSVMMRGRSPCLELRGGLGTIQGSDSEFRSTARAKFKVSKAVATWEARTLSAATRLFTNSGDSHMASVINARTIQARGGCKSPQATQTGMHYRC